ncbi:MAG TPA: VIT1/CCC1 transporter family protein [Candidatus Dormibacteraeota bacterium]|jgi:VIT1/CCC1 family predicted Fe2+/Mn2+ transporter|nr:VIT1/CCC1 transporter family protein [Candidatus Dormibacteraeota bacterium]
MNAIEPDEGSAARQAAGGDKSIEAAAHIDVTRARVAARSRVREIIFGTQDGLLTTLGLVSGVGSATTNRYTILVAGMAGSLAGMIAMGAGAYISSKSQFEVAEAEVARERAELEFHPERELEELVHLFQSEGLPERDARLVAEKIAERPEAMLKAMTEKELGLSLDSSQPRREALVMALAFLVGAIVPLAPWFVVGTEHVIKVATLDISPALVLSVSATIVVLLAMGAGKARVAHASIIRGALEIVGIGLLAAITGYILGSFLPYLLGASAVP